MLAATASSSTAQRFTTPSWLPSRTASGFGIGAEGIELSTPYSKARRGSRCSSELARPSEAGAVMVCDQFRPKTRIVLMRTIPVPFPKIANEGTWRGGLGSCRTLITLVPSR